LSFAEDCSLSEIRFHLMRVKSLLLKQEEGAREGVQGAEG
jgi:hypothetical protein